MFQQAGSTPASASWGESTLVVGQWQTFLAKQAEYGGNTCFILAVKHLDGGSGQDHSSPERSVKTGQQTMLLHGFAEGVEHDWVSIRTWRNSAELINTGQP